MNCAMTERGVEHEEESRFEFEGEDQAYITALSCCDGLNAQQ